MTADDLETLRRLGFSEEAVMDAVQIIAFFNYITRVADALGLEPEEFLETEWGRRPAG
jgi:alkylhydroperoxidase family enzyme